MIPTNASMSGAVDSAHANRRSIRVQAPLNGFPLRRQWRREEAGLTPGEFEKAVIAAIGIGRRRSAADRLAEQLTDLVASPEPGGP